MTTHTQRLRVRAWSEAKVLWSGRTDHVCSKSQACLQNPSAGIWISVGRVQSDFPPCPSPLRPLSCLSYPLSWWHCLVYTDFFFSLSPEGKLECEEEGLTREEKQGGHLFLPGGQRQGGLMCAPGWLSPAY